MYSDHTVLIDKTKPEMALVISRSIDHHASDLIVSVMRQNMDAFLTSPGPQYRINGGVC
jgi:hypothetical protein